MTAFQSAHLAEFLTLDLMSTVWDFGRMSNTHGFLAAGRCFASFLRDLRFLTKINECIGDFA